MASLPARNIPANRSGYVGKGVLGVEQPTPRRFSRQASRKPPMLKGKDYARSSCSLVPTENTRSSVPLDITQLGDSFHPKAPKRTLFFRSIRGRLDLESDDNVQKHDAFLSLAPYLKMPKDDAVASHGNILFTGLDTPVPFGCVGSYSSPAKVLELMQQVWGLKLPSVIFSVTGSAQFVNLDPRVEPHFKHGLALAAGSAEAWVLSGGSSTGVMELTGEALVPLHGKTPCIAVMPFRKVTHRERFSRAKMQQRALVRYNALSAKGKAAAQGTAGIDQNHTHCLMVDDGNDSFGGELGLRTALEELIKEQHEVPTVLIVVQGGPNTEKFVRSSLEHDLPVVVVKESGGYARTVAMIVEKLAHIKDDSMDEEEWEEFRQELELSDSALGLAKVAIKNCGITDTKRHQLVHVFSLDHAQGSFDMVILNAVVSFYKLREDKRRIELERMKRHKQLMPLVPLERAPHNKARGRHPDYPERFRVPDAKVPWAVPFPAYSPTHFEHPVLEKNTRVPPKGGKWADPVDKMTKGPPKEMFSEICSRKTFEGPLAFDETSLAPINPRGRTGMTGRGLLGLWGANHAADPIVTRWNPASPSKLQMVAILRRDTGEWAIPGGMVDAGEQVSVTVRREFEEEAGNFADDPKKQALFKKLIDQLFSQGEIVYQGYVDDPRNTDNAWMETTAFHFHCPDELGKLLSLKAGDDAAKVVWLETDPQREPRYASLYASHRKMVDRVAEAMHRHDRARKSTKHYPRRAEVPQHLVSWHKAFPEYDPPDFTHARIEAMSRDSPGGKQADPLDVEYVDPHTGEHFSKELEQRETFEGPILMEQGKPLNPRGRTGLKGRGLCPRWGPNHRADTIVTRWHPQENKLQFAACYNGHFVLPNYDVEKAGDVVSRVVHEQFLHEAATTYASNGAIADSVKTMLDDLFTGATNTPLFQGYVDHEYNTDNAWFETTAMHFHCSRELGAMLPLNLPFTATVFNVRWLTVNEQQQHYQSMRHEHKAYIRRAQELVQRKMSAGLLQLVVRWGRHEMLRNVLRDPSLVEQRQVQQVQQAFNDALKLSTVPSYDTKVVDVLLDQGARAQEVFAATLFELDGDSLYSDAFGYCAGMSVAAPDEASFRRPSYASSPRLSGESVASASRFSRAIGQVRLMNKAIPLQPKSQMSTKSSPSRRRRLPNSRGLMMMLRIVRMARRNRKRIAASAINVEGWNSPWRNEHVRKLQKFVVGFDGYAVTRHTLDTFDIVLWAILCGAFKLASTLWLRQECESPLRLSLLVQHMCMKIRLKEKKRINELQETEDFFNRYAIKLLDNIPDQETARKLLLSTASPKATLGAPKDIRLSLLDLAIDLRNVQFISHRHCQAVIDDIWKGRSPDCGKVQLATLPQNHLIFLQIPAAACFIQLLRLKTNDLYEWPADRIVDGQVLVSPAEALADLFKIPLVKRQVALVSQLVFTIFSTVMFFLPLCGEVGAHHVIYTIWVFANMLAEGHQYSNSSTKWRHNFFNKVDFIVLFLLFIATVLRFVLIDVDGVIHDRIPSLDFADWLNQIYHPSAGELRPSWYQTKVPPTLRNSDCPWSIEMEILRTLLGLAIFLLLFRMLEFMAFHYDIGVLMVCAECMISDLAKWLPLMLTVTMGAALGFNILAPNYHLEDAPGPFHLIPSLSLDLSVGGPFMATFWALFGFYDPAALALGQGTTMLAPLFMWVYLMISVILFVNLLIAMFSDSYSAISKNSDAEWWMSRVLKIKTYMALDPIPTPLNFPVKLYCVVRDLLCSRKGPDKDEDRKGDPIDASGPAAMAQSVLANRLRPSCRRSSTNFYKPRQPPSLLCTASSDNTTIGTFKKTDSTDELTRGDHGKRESHYGGPLNSLFSARDAEVVEATAREKLLVSHIAEERVRNRQVEALDRLQSEMQDADVAISECRNAVVSLQHQVTKLDERLSIAFGDEPTSTRSPSSGKAYRLKGRTATFRRLKEDGDTLPDSDLRSQMSELLSVVKGLAAAPHLSAKRSQQHSSKVDSKVAQAIALASDAGPPAGLLQTPVHRAPPAIPNSESSKDPKASLPFGQPPQLRTLSTPPELQHVCDQASPNSQSSTCKKPPKPITKQATFVPYGKSAVKQPHLALPRAAEPPGASPSVLPEATAPPAASPFVLPQAAAPPAAPPSVLPQEAERPATESRRIESDSPLARAIEMRMQGVQRGKSSKLRTGWT